MRLVLTADQDDASDDGQERGLAGVGWDEVEVHATGLLGALRGRTLNC